MTIRTSVLFTALSWVAAAQFFGCAKSSPNANDTSTGDTDDEAAPSQCDPGDTRECVGSGACKGGQRCGEDAKWGECDCGGRTSPEQSIDDVSDANAGIPAPTTEAPTRADDTDVTDTEPTDSTPSVPSNTRAMAGDPADAGLIPTAPSPSDAALPTQSGNPIPEANVLDLFDTCDPAIEPVSERSGLWYFFATDHDVVDAPPGPGVGTGGPFDTEACAAWASGQSNPPIASRGDGNGFYLHSTRSGYDVSDYRGIGFEHQGTAVDLVVLTDRGKFSHEVPGAENRAVAEIDFAELVFEPPLRPSPDSESEPLELTNVQAIEFRVARPGYFQHAIYGVWLL